MNPGNDHPINGRPRAQGHANGRAEAQGGQGYAPQQRMQQGAHGRPASFRGDEGSQARQQRPSRDTLVQMYNAQDATRARNARMYSQEAMQDFQQREAAAMERRQQREAFAARSREEQLAAARSGRKGPGANSHMTQAQAQQRAREIRAMNRVRQPLTTQESHDQTQMSREAYEHERARRDVLSATRQNRTSNREVIDGRGSIDSRAFNERNELVGYSIDEHDKPEPLVDSTDSPSRWNSHAGQEFMAPEGRGFRRNADLGSLSDAISGRSDYKASKPGFADIPLSVKLLSLLIVVLVIVLVVLLFL